MRKMIFLVAAAAAFGLGPLSSKLGTVGGAALLLALGIALSLAASGAVGAVAAASGALGAFAGAALAGGSPAIAGAALVGFAYAERTLRVRGTSANGSRALARLAHLGAALGAGALAGSISAAYLSASITVRAVAVIVCAVLAALPLLVEADDPLAHALDGAAADVSEPARAKLREGAELRRHADEELLDRRSAREVRRTWRALLRLAESRIRLERSVAGRPPGTHAERVRALLDERIADHVSVLGRAYVAIDTAHAAEASLDDAALRNVETVGESLEQVSKAMVEDV
jgi:MFS family permease